MNLLFLIVLLGSSALWGQTSYVPPTRVLKERGTQISGSVDYFKTSKLADEKGRKTSLADGQSFNRYQGEVNGLFGLTDSFNAGIGFRYRHQTSAFNVGTDEYNAKASGVQSIMARFLYGFEPVDRTQFTLEGMFRYIPYGNEEISATNTSDRNKLILGDEGNEYSIGLGMTYSSLSNNHYTLRGGWRRPGDDLSTEFYWNGEIALQWRWVAALAGIDGVTSLENSTYESDPTERPAWNTGVTQMYNSINREWMAPYVGLNFAFSHAWRVEFKVSQTVSGSSTDLGSGFGISLVRRLDQSDEKIIDSQFKTYDLEATVTKVSEKKTYVVIDKGLNDDLEKGMRFDFYEFDYVGGNILIARGVVFKVSADKSIVKLTHRFNLSKEIKEGLVGRASLK
ncbi:MAG: hypothetical protein V4598_19605 [Bdellovibrionota bacterium]